MNCMCPNCKANLKLSVSWVEMDGLSSEEKACGCVHIERFREIAKSLHKAREIFPCADVDVPRCVRTGVIDASNAMANLIGRMEAAELETIQTSHEKI